MKRLRRVLDVNFDKKVLSAALIDTKTTEADWDKKELKTLSAYFVLNGAPEFSVNEKGNARFQLLAGEKEFIAAKAAGIVEFSVRVYRFSEKNAETFCLIEKLKAGNMGAMDEAYIMRRLVKDYHLKQEDIAEMVGKSRPAIANTLRLLTLHPEVIGMVESGKLSAGHARTLVKVPQEKQRAFAEEGLRRGYSVREMERTVKAFLTPPEVLKQEREAKAAAKSEALKDLVERMRAVLGTQVSLIGNDKKGRIYIDYQSPETLIRIEEALGIQDQPDRQLSLFSEEE
ncbi:MAG: ParB/RepB/Spo0J family partition protein [Clostridia bacterium]|nr:ParB/RepB/Spo0J family partition protein [Clostridia bacterium]